MSDYRLHHYYPSHPLPHQPAAGPSNAPPQNNADPYSTSHSDDLKYIAKYRELKDKVHEAEMENDRLHLKVLKTRKNIQRLRLERAILYERLAATPTQDSDTAPFPSDPTVFPPAQPPQPNPASTHYDHFSAPEGSIEYISQDLPRHKHTHRTQTSGPPPAPSRRQTRHSDDASHAGPSRPNKAVPDSEPVAPPSAPVPGPADGARTFPFVHEYTHTPVTVSPGAAYPAEVRFYPYESSTHPVQRSRRDFEQGGSAGRVAERDHEIRFRHHRPETQGRETTHSPEETHGNHAYPLQHPFLSPDDVGRDEEPVRMAYGPQAEDPRRRETANGDRKRKNSAGAVHERSQEDYEHGQLDTGRHLHHPRRSSYSQGEQEEGSRQPRSARDERQRARRREDEAPPRMQEGEVMD